MRAKSIIAITVAAIGTNAADARDIGRTYSSHIRPGSGGGEVRYIMLSNEKSIVGNSIVAQGKSRELIIEDKRRRSSKDVVFTIVCSTEPGGGNKVPIMYGGDPVFIDPSSTDVSMADKRHHDLWRAACKNDFSGGM